MVEMPHTDTGLLPAMVDINPLAITPLSAILRQNHTNVKYAGVYDIMGRGLLFSTRDKFEFCASHFTSDDLTKALHTNELKARAETFVRIDYKVGGIGTGSCGPYTLDKYLLSEKKINYSFYVTPVNIEEMKLSEKVKRIGM